ncbi:uncharacterized protein LOC114435464 [Parambassis ranga]|uniref:Uncharacterized protein LOC114435464 n=1 Tax=Parambassis ranga TaxID=210632 RepID=A0A6P7I8E1_9TELE|nr:uncharacterized protein LOC114435464 [Parambassis ranga]
MASKNAKTRAGNGVESGPSSESNEHDYAHSAETNFTSTEASSSGTTAEPTQSATVQPSSSSLQVELPEPALGAEVDCPGGNDIESQNGSDSRKTAASKPAAVSRGRRRPSRVDARTKQRDANCCCCKTCLREFERQGRSFNRRAVYTFTTTETVHWAFPGCAVHDKSFLCETCAQVIRSKCKRTQAGKRTLWVKPPVTKKTMDKKMLGRRMGKKSKAALLVSKSSYKAAFQMLWSAKGARKPMMEFWKKQLKAEMKVLSRQPDSPFHQKVSGRKPLSSFPWRRCLNWAQDKAPLVISCLRSLFPDINALYKSNHQLTEEQAYTLLERRAVVALSIPLFTRNIWKNNFLQAALGAELRLQGCSGTALDTLNTMGLCQNKDTIRLLLHRLRNDKDTEGEQGMIKSEQIKESMTDVEEADSDEEENEEEEKDEEEEDDEEEGEMVMGGEEEVEEEEDPHPIRELQRSRLLPWHMFRGIVGVVGGQ